MYVQADQIIGRRPVAQILRHIIRTAIRHDRRQRHLSDRRRDPDRGRR